MRVLKHFLPACATVLIAVSFALDVSDIHQETSICNGNECYPRVFVPTDEFQVVKEGQEIPKGLHVRINMQTGLKEAKLYDPTRDEGRVDTLVLSPNRIQVADSEESKQETRAIATYKVPNRQAAGNGVDTEQDIFQNAFDALQSTHNGITTDQLRSLEIFAHDRDFGGRLVESKILPKLLKIARSNAYPDNRKSAFRILGSSLWNNEAALANVNEISLISDLLDALKREGDDDVTASLIFSLSAVMVKPGGFKHFMDLGGSQLLREAFASKDAEVKAKCATFVEDNYRLDREVGGDAQEISLWCHHFQKQILETPTSIGTDRILTALIALKTEAGDVCDIKHEFVEWMATTVVEGSEDEHVYELVKSARHRFGNPKAARKTAWEEQPTHHVRDEL